MQIDGFEQEKKVVVVAATNRKQDLDPALIRYLGKHNHLYHRRTSVQLFLITGSLCLIQSI